MFATVAVVGFQTLSRVDFNDHRNVVIVATSVGLAMYVTAQPQVAQAVPDWAEIIFGSGITLGSITAIVLNIVFHHVGKGYGPAVAGQPGDAVRLDQVNEMSREEFVETFGGLFQGPRWVVERAYDTRPFADTHALRRSFQEALFTGSHEEQRQLIESYPQLGSQLVPTASAARSRCRTSRAARPDPPGRRRARRAGRASPRPTASGSGSRSSSRSATRSRSTRSSSRAGPAGQLREPGARRRTDRDRQDRRLPLRRLPVGGQPDPHRAHPLGSKR